MATGRPSRGDRDGPEDLLPADGVLSLDEYLAMHTAVGHRTRYEILYRLVHTGPMSPKELEEAISIDDSTLHYHLNKLVDVGLVENRKRKEPTSDGLYSYYRATSLGEGLLDQGVRELMREEWALLEAYA